MISIYERLTVITNYFGEAGYIGLVPEYKLMTTNASGDIYLQIYLLKEHWEYPVNPRAGIDLFEQQLRFIAEEIVRWLDDRIYPIS